MLFNTPFRPTSIIAKCLCSNEQHLPSENKNNMRFMKEINTIVSDSIEKLAVRSKNPKKVPAKIYEVGTLTP